VVLGLKARATRDQIVSAYRRLAMQHHPDRGGDPEEFIKVTDAYKRALARMPVAWA
jgi:DnaJ family protein A protein 2